MATLEDAALLEAACSRTKQIPNRMFLIIEELSSRIR